MSNRKSTGAWGSAEKRSRHVERLGDGTEVVPFSMSDFEDSYDHEQESKFQQNTCHESAQHASVEYEDIFSSDEAKDLKLRLKLG